jgi:hypothetical protein
MSPLNIVIAIVLIFIIFMLLRYILINPYNLSSLQSGTVPQSFPLTSLTTSSTSRMSSNYSFSIWFYVNDWTYNWGYEKFLFGINDASVKNNTTKWTPCPYVTLGSSDNTVNIYVASIPTTDGAITPNNLRKVGTTYPVPTVVINNIPLQSWVNLTISIYGTTLDSYIDGKLVNTTILRAQAYAPKDIYSTTSQLNLTNGVLPNTVGNSTTPSAGSFSGWTSRLQYYPTPINPQQAWNIYSQGYTDWFSGFGYQLQFALVENGQVQTSLTI